MRLKSLLCVFCPVRNNKTAQITVTGKINIILFVKFKMDATAIAPNAT